MLHLWAAYNVGCVTSDAAPPRPSSSRFANVLRHLQLCRFPMPFACYGSPCASTADSPRCGEPRRPRHPRSPGRSAGGIASSAGIVASVPSCATDGQGHGADHTQHRRAGGRVVGCGVAVLGAWVSMTGSGHAVASICRYFLASCLILVACPRASAIRSSLRRRSGRLPIGRSCT